MHPVAGWIFEDNLTKVVEYIAALVIRFCRSAGRGQAHSTIREPGVGRHGIRLRLGP
jgi:hypothetical protein